MGLSEMLDVVRHRFRWVMAATAIAVLAAAGAAQVTPKTYSSTTTLYVTAMDTTDAAALSQGAQYVQSQIRSYPTLLTAPAVLRRVADDVGAPDLGALAARVTGEVPVDSALLNITTTAGTAQEAARLATSFAQHFSTEITTLETRPGAKQSPIRVSTVAPAYVPEAPTSPVVRNYLLMGLVGGALLGLVLAALRELYARHR